MAESGSNADDGDDGGGGDDSDGDGGDHGGGGDDDGGDGTSHLKRKNQVSPLPRWHLLTELSSLSVHGACTCLSMRTISPRDLRADGSLVR